MENLLELLFPTARGESVRELFRMIADFGDRVRSEEFTEEYESCCDLSDLGNDPDLGVVIQNLERYLPKICEKIEPAVMVAMHENETLCHSLRLGIWLAEGIYPQVSGHHFLEIRQNPLWIQWRQGLKTIRHRPPETELVQVPIQPGDLPPAPTWPEQLQRLLGLFGCTLPSDALLELTAQTPSDRFNAVNHLAEGISQHLRSKAFGATRSSDTAQTSSQFAFWIHPHFTDNSNHLFVFNDYHANADRRESSEVVTPSATSETPSPTVEADITQAKDSKERPAQSPVPQDSSLVPTDVEAPAAESEFVDQQVAASSDVTARDLELPTNLELPQSVEPSVTAPSGISTPAMPLPPQSFPEGSKTTGLTEPQRAKADGEVLASSQTELPPWKEWAFHGCIVTFGQRRRPFTLRQVDLLQAIVSGPRLHTVDEIHKVYYMESPVSNSDRKRGLSAAISKLNDAIRNAFEGLPHDFNPVHRLEKGCRGGNCRVTISMPDGYPRTDPPSDTSSDSA